MTDIRPVDGLTVEQLLDALRERVTSILFVAFRLLFELRD